MTEARLAAARWPALATLCLLALGSLIFHRERMLFADPSLVLFEIIRRGEPLISESRYAALSSQWLPWLGVELGLPLRHLLWMYSFSFYLFYLIVAAALVRWRQYALLILWVCYLTLFVSDVYFWPNNEVHQGTGWALLFVGAYYRLRERPPAPGSLRVILEGATVAAALIALNAHLLVAAILSFVWVYWALDRGAWRRLSYWLYSVLLLAAVGLRYHMSHDSWYDGPKLQGVRSLGLSSALDAFSSGQVITTLDAVWWNYWLVPLLLLLGGGALVRWGRWIQLPTTVAAVIVYVMLIGVTYPQSYDRHYRFYFESEWMGLGLIAVTPFVTALLPRLPRRWIIGSLLLIFGIRIGYIAAAADYFRIHLANVETSVNWLREQPASDGKFYVVESPQLIPYLGQMYWALPTETALLSANDPVARPVTLKVLPSHQQEWSDHTDRFLHQKAVPLTDIDTSYFPFATGSAYQEVGTDELVARLSLLPK